MIHVRRPQSKNGFTLIELMLAMSFVGILLVAIAATTMQVMSTYTKGITVREVNQVGRTISEDIKRTVAASAPFEVDPIRTGDASDSLGSKYVELSGRGGRLCTGAYTYVWNYGATEELSGDEGGLPVYNVYEDGGEVIRLAKVNDEGGVLCANLEQQVASDQAIELLSAGDRNLVVQKFSVTPGSRHDASSQALYAITLVLGTNDRAQLHSTDGTCLPPTEGSGSEDFCAINQFDIIARAGNRSGSLR